MPPSISVIGLGAQETLMLGVVTVTSSEQAPKQFGTRALLAEPIDCLPAFNLSASLQPSLYRNCCITLNLLQPTSSTRSTVHAVTSLAQVAALNQVAAGSTGRPCCSSSYLQGVKAELPLVTTHIGQT